MSKVFISYRRKDSPYAAQSIYSSLALHFGSESIVFDVDTFPAGVDFREYLNEAVNRCDVLLVIIGDKWVEELERRDDTKDFVRIEIQSALESQIPIVPVLVDAAEMPAADALPLSLRQLAFQQGLEVRVGRDLENHLGRLIDQLEHMLKRLEDERKARGGWKGSEAIELLVFGSLMQQMDNLSFFRHGDAHALERQLRDGMLLLRQRLEKDSKEGRIELGRAKTLSYLLDDFDKTVGSGRDDLESLKSRVQNMRTRVEAQFENMKYLSHVIERPHEGSRAAKLIELTWPLRLFLLNEMNRAKKSPEEIKAVFDLSLRAADVDKRIYEVGSDEAQAIMVDREAIRPLALEIRSFAARHHPLLARPIWSGARVPVDTNAVLFVGERSTRQMVGKICWKFGWRLMSLVKGRPFALTRWQQLQKANVTIFDISVAEGPDLAAITYELGIAFTLNKPIVVLARDEKIPFDIDVNPVLLSGTTQDEAAISEAIDNAFVQTIPRPSSSTVAAVIEHFLKQYPPPQADTEVDQTVKQLQQLLTDPDPVAVTGALKTLEPLLGDDGPILLNSLWPPAYPDTDKGHLFHILPFIYEWVDEAVVCVKTVCKAAGFEYISPYMLDHPNIIHSIWHNINRASHILVDLTGFNANAALELGIAHTLGRPTRIIGKDNTVDRLFPMIAKLRVFSYYDLEYLEHLVTEFLGVESVR